MSLSSEKFANYLWTRGESKLTICLAVIHHKRLSKFAPCAVVNLCPIWSPCIRLNLLKMTQTLRTWSKATYACAIHDWHHIRHYNFWIVSTSEIFSFNFQFMIKTWFIILIFYINFRFLLFITWCEEKNVNLAIFPFT